MKKARSKKRIKRHLKRKKIARKPIKKTKKRIKKTKKVKKIVRKSKRMIRRSKKTVKKPTKKIRKFSKRKPPKKKATKKKRAKKPAKRIKRIKRFKRIKRRRRPRKKIARKTYSTGSSLEQLFESPAKVQVMKLFFRNPEKSFLLKEAAKIMRLNLAMTRKQAKKLEKIGILKTKQISPRKQIISLNPNFDFLKELKELVLRACPVSKEKMLKSIRGLGRIKLVLLSGLFVNSSTARADLLIVGDSINHRKLPGFIKNLEAESGTDINCVVMTTEEFKYRYDMYDRFVRDLLNEKSEFLMNKLNI